MNCYDCSLQSNRREAVGLCRNCSAGLCSEHVHEEEQEITVVRIINREVALPLRARTLLCGVCKAALEQPR